MDTSKLKKFAQASRKQLNNEIATRLEVVLKTDSSELREKEKALKELKNQINKTSKDMLIERVAYIWFNRFCAFRFMDVNRFTRINVVSPAEGFTQPEILAEAKQGHIDDSLNPFLNQQNIFDLLSGRTPSQDPQNEAYRLLLVGMCNYFNASMPFLFERIADYTELLIPNDLLSETSVLSAVTDTLTPEICNDVEVIGWLYQFYISEKKDDVFAGLKKNKKITPENIPAATQLFTPNWIVRYLVENSLGRLWMLNHPNSRLIDQMAYYIKPEEDETDYLKISSPEEIKVCDPACGSGHMLVYAFELLYAIYQEEGYDASEIPEKILINNLYGIEIDERAGVLAAFALTMKAREKYRRFLNKKIQPNICVLENVRFEEGEIKSYMDQVGRELFTSDLLTTLNQFEEADNFGSLIRPVLKKTDDLIQMFKDAEAGVYVKTRNKVLQVLEQAEFLRAKYHVVVANPPYMGGKGMNARLGTFLKNNYPDVKSDLFSAFIVRNTELTLAKGQLGYMSPFVWMFISSYEKLRNFLINKKTITSLVQLEYSGFDGATVPICTFTVENSNNHNFKGGYVRLSDFRGSKNQGLKTLEAIKNPNCGWFYRASAADFKKIPGSPIAYWVSEIVKQIFENSTLFSNIAPPKQGIATANNEQFLRRWFELNIKSIHFFLESKEQALEKNAKWLPYNKGGNFRKWYGNCEFVINWENDGEQIRNFRDEKGKQRSAIRNPDYYFLPSVTWTDISSSAFGVRRSDIGFLFDGSSHSAFPKREDLNIIIALLCSKVAFKFLKIINPTLHFQVGNIAVLPILENEIRLYTHQINKIADSIIDRVRMDWNSYETSWDFSILPLLQHVHRYPTLKENYDKLNIHNKKIITEIKELEEKNNSIFINAYGLQDDLSPDVQLSEVTLTCNPYYKYSDDKSEEIYEALLLADTMKEFISYAVGCMFGRYALDKPGLILANQGETIEDYLKQIPKPTFPADDDNVIPMLDGDWFTDDITERFKKFLRITFGEEHYEENLKFLETAIGKDVRKFFLKDFYNDHIKRYKKRPIYWMFSSSKGSFNALIYMHRYRSDTVSVVLNEYLREFHTKLTAKKSHLEQVNISATASKKEKTTALKAIEKLKMTINELEEYEHDILYPLATKQIEIDLDDGVKVNYNKFGKALKKVTGLSGK
jgi:type II restriction/modification system DNA methylase subunit YeeA